MKKKVLTVVLSIESVLLVLAVLFIIVLAGGDKNTEQTTLTQENDPTGRYAVTVWRIGEPTWSFGPDRLKVQLFDTENPEENVSFEADVKSDGAYATYEIEWVEDGAKITLYGSEQAPAAYILLFPE